MGYLRDGRRSDNYILCSNLGLPKQTTRIKRGKNFPTQLFWCLRASFDSGKPNLGIPEKGYKKSTISFVTQALNHQKQPQSYAAQFFRKNTDNHDSGLIFTITNYAIGAILEVFTVTSVTGAAGSLMILLLWIYLSSLLTIYGAALSKVYSEIPWGSNCARAGFLILLFMKIWLRY